MYFYFPVLILFFWVMKGREDDNIETIRKRFKVFLESSLPVIEHYNSREKVRKVVFYCCSDFDIFNFWNFYEHLSWYTFCALIHRLMLQGLLKRFLSLLKLFLPQKMRRYTIAVLGLINRSCFRLTFFFLLILCGVCRLFDYCFHMESQTISGEVNWPFKNSIHLYMKNIML